MNDGLRQGDVSIEDLGVEVEQSPIPMSAEPSDAAAH